jgi:hypothetical protein
VGNYFLELLGPDLIVDPMQVLSLCDSNVGMSELYTTFLWFLHYSELKRLIQSHQHEGIKVLMPSLFHLMRLAEHSLLMFLAALSLAAARCSNHTKVAEQLLRVHWCLLTLIPELVPHYMAEWTKALSNLPSRGVSINMKVEHSNADLNKKAKGELVVGCQPTCHCVH